MRSYRHKDYPAILIGEEIHYDSICAKILKLYLNSSNQNIVLLFTGVGGTCKHSRPNEQLGKLLALARLQDLHCKFNKK